MWNLLGCYLEFDTGLHQPKSINIFFCQRDAQYECYFVEQVLLQMNWRPMQWWGGTPFDGWFSSAIKFHAFLHIGRKGDVKSSLKGFLKHNWFLDQESFLQTFLQELKFRQTLLRFLWSYFLSQVLMLKKNCFLLLMLLVIQY